MPDISCWTRPLTCACCSASSAAWSAPPCQSGAPLLAMICLTSSDWGHGLLVEVALEQIAEPSADVAGPVSYRLDGAFDGVPDGFRRVAQDIEDRHHEPALCFRFVITRCAQLCGNAADADVLTWRAGGRRATGTGIARGAAAGRDRGEHDQSG
ncbi:hypothetical protein CU254_27650 [Amycolatopsis sp. AA4]|uniref:hypothetical protein n=1 Tax=Actinomycetes TaxID=1760 RepID=UPI0001B575C3|nr:MULTISPECIES: hypothetical protein [Actinomycetes]ATY13786.1 hypothetical protein CU254_27650 [Amycolatopsis sp. AA4]